MESGNYISITEVKYLLDKYFEGTTSLEQEQVLRHFFCSATDIPEELGYARAVFGFFADAALETGRQAQHPARSLAEKQAAVEETPMLKKRGLLYYLAGAATAAAVVTLLVLLSPGDHGIVSGSETIYCYVDGQPVTDLDLALMYSEKALGHISGTLNNTLPETSVFETFEKLEYITGLGEILDKMKK